MMSRISHISVARPKCIVVENVHGFRVPAWGEEKSALQFFMSEVEALDYTGTVLESDLQDIHECVRARSAAETSSCLIPDKKATASTVLRPKPALRALSPAPLRSWGSL